MAIEKFRVGKLGFSRKEVKYYLCAGLLIFLIAWVYGYILLLNSSGYSFGLDYLKNNKIVQEQLGNIVSSRPGFVNFKSRFSEGKSSASFYVVLKGDKASGIVFLALESLDKEWKVKTSNLKLDRGGSYQLLETN